jgi:hypothetical protein
MHRKWVPERHRLREEQRSELLRLVAAVPDAADQHHSAVTELRDFYRSLPVPWYARVTAATRLSILAETLPLYEVVQELLGQLRVLAFAEWPATEREYYEEVTGAP